MSNKLFNAISAAGIDIKKAAEVGVLSVETSMLKEIMESGIQCDLYEAIPEFCDDIKQKIKGYKQVVLHEVAVSDYNGEMELCMAGASTFNAALDSSPAICHDGLQKSDVRRVKVTCVDFRDIDPGDYDLVSIDVEGGEYSILSRMRSRPKVISLETQSRDYCNPKLGSITDWMLENGYRVWIWNNTDTIFYKGTPPELRFLETLKAKWHSFKYYALRI